MMHSRRSALPAMKLLRSNLAIVRERLRGDWDALMFIDGGGRRGKTVYASHVIRIFNADIERAILCADYAPFLARCSWTFGEYRERLAASQPCDVVALHEAMVFNRESLSAANIEAVRVLSSQGERNVLQLWTWTRFWRVDQAVREHTRFRMYVVPLGHGTRGMIRAYVARERADPPGPGEPLIKHIPVWQERFPDFKELGPQHAEAWAQLVERDHARKEEILREGGASEVESIARRLADRGLKLADIVRIVGRPRSTVRDWLAGSPPRVGGVGDGDGDRGGESAAL